MNREIWKSIPSFPGYEASSLGRIRHGDVVLVSHPNQKGYHRVNTRRGRKLKKAKVHQLVAEAFYGPRPPHLHTAHLDCDKDNNCLSNPLYVTPKVNASHGHDEPFMRDRVFVPLKGEQHPRRKLTIAAVKYIRRNYAWGKREALARRFRIHPHTVTKVARRDLWRHVAA